MRALTRSLPWSLLHFGAAAWAERVGGLITARIPVAHIGGALGRIGSPVLTTLAAHAVALRLELRLV